MKRFLFVAVLLIPLFIVSGEACAANKVVAADLTENFVGVSEGFGGAKLTVFGVLKNKSDAVVVIEGPAMQATVRQKTKQFGVWINGEPESLGPVPGFYAVVSSKPISEIVQQDSARQYGLDIDHLPFMETTAGQGFAQERAKDNMFQYHPEGVQILESNLFRADVVFPSNVPIGTYRVLIYEFSKKRMIAMRTETVNIAQIGITAWISALAHGNPLLYAFLAVACALGIGGAAAYAFRKVS